MLSQAIGGALPAAVAVAFSPIPIIAIVVMLGTPRARPNGTAFAAGWVVGLAAVSTVVLVLAHGAGTNGSDAASGVRWGTLAIGILFLVMAVRQLRARPSKGETPELPAWIATVDRFRAPKAAVTGLALSAINPKNLALTATAAAAIAQQGLDAAGDAAAVAVFVTVASVTVVGALVLFVVAPRPMARVFESVMEFMVRYNAVIMFVILLILGIKLVGDGIAG